jgi:unsaturated rhamnogalacturonyl hydrolase
MKKIGFKLLVFFIVAPNLAFTQVSVPEWSEMMARTVLNKWKDSLSVKQGKPVHWAYDQGVVLEGIANIWKRTGKGEYFNYIQRSMDMLVSQDGDIRQYKKSDFNIDNIKNGRSLMLLFKTTESRKYYKAATTLRQQLEKQPRTSEGGFWHKKIYPNQMWLDGLYMGAPFYTEYAASFNEVDAFTDIANQFVYMERHARDDQSGLLYHAWDETRKERWADKNTGQSKQFWGRAMGWYGMGLVDVLEIFPSDHPQRRALLDILSRFAASIIAVQDTSSGVWYQILDKPTGKGNYKESSASSMFVYTLAKAVRLGYLPPTYETAARKGYTGIIKEFIETDGNGQVNFKGTVTVAGLGGNPYRDGSYEYYLSEPVVTNDPKGVGAFLLASNEMELRNISRAGLGKTVVLDGFFNSETKPDVKGNRTPWHYKWNELHDGGFYLLGEHARYRGAITNELNEAPTRKNLQSAQVYVIVDPDTKKENPNPNFINNKHVKAIRKWVKQGGVLLLLANDDSNTDLDHLNLLSKEFGIEFLKESKNLVTGDQFDMGIIQVPPGNIVFSKPYQLYLKEISTLKLKAPARSVLVHKGDDVMAISKYGKGTVFAVGDPWLYNEYTDGRKLPPSYQNFAAGNELIEWLLTLVTNN